MANISTQSTYILDAETIHQLAELAEHWGTPKPAALRRAISEAACRVQRSNMEAIADLDRLHEQLVERQVDLEQWVRDVREERKASV